MTPEFIAQAGKHIVLHCQAPRSGHRSRPVADPWLRAPVWGQVRIDSKVGQGITVCVYLPSYYGKAAQNDVLAGLSEAPRADWDQTVLIVDDEPTICMLVTEVLQELGYTAIEAADGPSGLKVLQSDVRLDLLVTDAGLPGGMNGRQFADAGRAVRPDLKVLFITGYVENAVFESGYLDPGMCPHSPAKAFLCP